MGFNQEFYDNLTPFEWEDRTLYDIFVKDMEREPEDEQELLDWYEAKLSSLY